MLMGFYEVLEKWVVNSLSLLIAYAYIIFGHANIYMHVIFTQHIL